MEAVVEDVPQPTTEDGSIANEEAVAVNHTCVENAKTTTSDNVIFDHTFSHKGLLEGRMRYITYKGATKNLEPHGQGELWCKETGYRFQGTFVEGVPNGQG